MHYSIATSISQRKHFSRKKIFIKVRFFALIEQIFIHKIFMEKNLCLP